MGKKRRIASQRSANALDSSPHKLKKQKTSHFPLAEIPTARTPHSSGPDNRPANENQKPATVLPLDIAKKKKKKKKKTGGSQQKPETITPVEPVKKNKRPSKNKINREILKEPPKGIVYLKGRDVNKLLDRLLRVIEAKARHERKEHDNIWLKQLFSVGINEVTRTLERMPGAIFEGRENEEIGHRKQFSGATFEGRDNQEIGHRKQFSGSKTEAHGQQTHLQAVLAAIDCHPRVVVSHLAGLASSRGVPLFFVEDNGTGSMRLGQLLKLKTTTAIGVKVGGSTINSVIQDAINNRIIGRES